MYVDQIVGIHNNNLDHKSVGRFLSPLKFCRWVTKFLFH